MAASAITDMWYNGEVNAYLPSYYGEATPDFSNFENWGHFSQVVWKASLQVGCATQFCAAGTIFSGFPSWYTVCDYSGPGEFLPCLPNYPGSDTNSSQATSAASTASMSASHSVMLPSLSKL